MYWIELHIHTEAGSLDSTLNVEELISEYKRIGVDGVCITEHIKWGNVTPDEYGALYSAFDNYGGVGEIDIYPGAEVKICNGYEYLVIGIKIPYEWFRLDWNEAVQKIHMGGGIVIKSHPYRDEDVVVPEDGAEVFNYCSSQDKNQKALQYSEKHKELTYLVGCDAHSVDVIGMAITVLSRRPAEGIDLAKMLYNDEVIGYIINGYEYKREELNEKLFIVSINR